MAKKLILGASLLYLVMLTILIGMIFLASPGPQEQAIYGVGIGRYFEEGGIAYFSGRRMDCTNRTPLQSTCTIDIAGETLTLKATMSANGVNGFCEAKYAGESWYCRIGLGRAIGVYRYAYIEEPLGLSAAQLNALRMRYPIENLNELPFMAGCLVLPILNVAAILVLVWWRMPSRLRKNIPVWAASAGMSTVIWFVSLYGWLRLTSGFMD